MAFKRVIISWLRHSGLLHATDKLLLLKSIILTGARNTRFKKTHKGFPVPPYGLAFDAYNHTDWHLYYQRGIEHGSYVADLVNEYVKQERARIAEWGCGPGRVLRHIRTFLNAAEVELFGFDYNETSIKWCRENIQGIDFRANALIPPLPIEPDTLDCIYALSVFTHLSEQMQHEWIRELFRVVKRGGVIIFTTHGDRFKNKLLVSEKEQYERGELVVQGKTREGKKWFLAYHSPAYVRNKLLRDKHIIRHIPSPCSSGMLRQDIWVVAR